MEIVKNVYTVPPDPTEFFVSFRNVNSSHLYSSQLTPDIRTDLFFPQLPPGFLQARLRLGTRGGVVLPSGTSRDDTFCRNSQGRIYED